MQYTNNSQDILLKKLNDVNYYITRNNAYVFEDCHQYILTRSPSEDIINYNSWHNMLIIAVKDNIVVGHAMIQYFRNFYNTYAFFYGLNVLPEYRNLGIGNELLKCRLEICKKMKNVTLITSKTNIGCLFGSYSAKNLQKNGFKRTTNEEGQTSSLDISIKEHVWQLIL